MSKLSFTVASAAVFGALWDAQLSADPARIEAAITALDNEQFAVGSYGYEDSGMVGADEIVGSEDDLVEELVGAGYDIVGAHVKAAQIRGQGAQRVVRKVEERRRILLCPFGPNVLAAGASANIQVQPQDLFRPERLVIPSDLAFFFALTDFKIGQKSVFTAAGQLPCATFTEPAQGVRLLPDTSNVGNVVTLAVTNIDAASRTFRAAIIGTAAV